MGFHTSQLERIKAQPKIPKSSPRRVRRLLFHSPKITTDLHPKPPAMAISAAVPILALLLAAAAAAAVAADSDAERVADLLLRRSSSPSGVIRLDDDSVRRFLSPHSRSYSLLIFFDAAQLRDKPDLHLADLRSEFALVSSSFAANNPPDSSSSSKLFFCDLEFKQSQSSFAQFGVNSLPHIRLVSPDATLKDSEPMDQSDLARLAESMAEFVERKTKLSVGPISRPPVVSKKQLVFLAVCFLASLPFLIKKVVAGETLLHNSAVWMFGAIFVYFFSVAGTMYNIIRKMPMFLQDRGDPPKLVFFYQGSGMQLGAEGLAVGFLYTVVGLLLGLVTHGLVRVSNATVQRAVMFVAIVVSFWAVRKVISLDNWKTGYSIHGYTPSSWD